MNVHAIVLPGGSYRNHAVHEAEPVARWLAGLGVAASVLRYPTNAPHPTAHNAIRDRVSRVRAGGAERVVLVGFSAGGHAAGLAALDQTPDARVDAAILGYPVVSLVEHVHEPTAETLAGPEQDSALRAALSLDSLVTQTAPPMFVFHALDDDKVSPEHSYLLSAALRAQGRPHELVVFPVGGHGFALGGPAQAWPPLAEAWLAGLGML